MNYCSTIPYFTDNFICHVAMKPFFLSFWLFVFCFVWVGHPLRWYILYMCVCERIWINLCGRVQSCYCSRHSQAVIQQLEKAGLGYHVSAEKTCDKLGQFGILISLPSLILFSEWVSLLSHPYENFLDNCHWLRIWENCFFCCFFFLFVCLFVLVFLFVREHKHNS